MAANATAFPGNHLERVQTVRAANVNRTRRISPRAGRALEMLGHAIEYLADEFAHQRKQVSIDDPQVQAIQLLMGLNRQIYFQCPVVPTLGERIRNFFRGRF